MTGSIQRLGDRAADQGGAGGGPRRPLVPTIRGPPRRAIRSSADPQLARTSLPMLAVSTNPLPSVSKATIGPASATARTPAPFLGWKPT